MMRFATTLNVKVEGTSVQMTGGTFWDMKNFVSDWDRWPGRKWDGASKTWELPPGTTLTTFREAVEGQGWQLLLSEDDQLDAEIATIEQLQKRVLWNAVEVAYREAQQDSIASEYSYNSQSRIKAAAKAASGCFHYALKYAKTPLEELTEPQIATLKAAIRRIDEAGCIPLEKLIFHFSIVPETCPFNDETFAARIVPLSSVNMAGVPKRGNDYCVQKYVCDLAVKYNLDRAEYNLDNLVFPDVTMSERFAPSGKLMPVVVFQVQR